MPVDEKYAPLQQVPQIISTGKIQTLRTLAWPHLRGLPQS
jgi:hypothetical protein